jgi:hypothetical protein
MNRREINQLTMLESVLAFGKANLAVLNQIPGLAIKIEELEQIILAVRDLRQVQSKTTVAATMSKNELGEMMKAGIIKICDAMLALGTVSNNNELKALGSVTESEILTMRDSNLVDKARQVAEAAEPIADALAVYFVNASDILKLKEHGVAFGNYLTGKSRITAQTKESTAAIKNKLTEGRRLLKDELDRLMKPFKTGNPTLFGEYTNVRSIVDIPAGRGKQTNEPGKAE